MIRWVTLGSVLCFLLAGSPAELFGQNNPYVNRPIPYGTVPEPGADPRVRRAYREKAVAAVGPKARAFVETHGEEAVAAIFACSKEVAVKLAEFHASGEMSKLPRPRDLLRVIAQPHHGDDVALWAIGHAHELADTDSFDAYLLSPLDYALGLKQLEAGAAEARARRLNLATVTPTPEPPSPPPLSLSANDKLGLVCCVAIVVIIGLIQWRRKKAAVC